MVSPNSPLPGAFKSGIFTQDTSTQSKTDKLTKEMKSVSEEKHGIVYRILSRVMSSPIGRPLAQFTATWLGKVKSQVEEQQNSNTANPDMDNLDMDKVESKLVEARRLAKIPYVKSLALQNSLRKEIESAHEDLKQFDGEITRANNAWESRMKALDEEHKSKTEGFQLRDTEILQRYGRIRNQILELKREDSAIQQLHAKLNKSLFAATGSPEELSPADSIKLGEEIQERRNKLQSAIESVEGRKNEFVADRKKLDSERSAAKEEYNLKRKEAYDQTLGAIDNKMTAARAKITDFVSSLEGTPLQAEVEGIRGYLNLLNQKLVVPRLEAFTDPMNTEIQSIARSLVDAKRSCGEQYKNLGLAHQSKAIGDLTREIVELKGELGSEGIDEKRNKYLQIMLDGAEERRNEATKEYHEGLDLMHHEFLDPIEKKIKALEAKLGDLNQPDLANIQTTLSEDYSKRIEMLRDKLKEIKQYKPET